MNEVVESPFGARAALVPETAGAKQGQSREIAETQAMAIMAKRFPRDPIAATDRILNAFTRITLAEQASYQYAKGGSDVSGASIRAAEAIAQQWGNISTGFSELSRGYGADGVPFSEVKAYAWDMESNNPKQIQFVVRHWRDTKKGGYKITDERDIYELVANQAQRRLRNCILALIPGDVTEAAMQQAEVTLKTKADCSPDAMAKMVAAFEPFGVVREQIEKRIQRHLDAIQPAQVVMLKRIYASLRDGMSAPQDWFDPVETEGAVTGGAAGLKAAATSKPAPKPAAKTSAPKGEPKDESPPVTYAELAERLKKAKTRDAADLLVDEARALPADQYDELEALADKAFPRG